MFFCSAPFPSTFRPSQRLFHQTGFFHRFQIHNSAVFKGVEGRHIENGVLRREDVVKAPLGDASLQRHLAAFKAGAHPAAGAGLLALVALAGGLTVDRSRGLCRFA